MKCPKCGSTELRLSGKAGSGRQRYWCVCGHRTTNPHQAPERLDFLTELPASARYVVTSAQNATPVFKPFLASLERYCARTGATLVIIPFRYRNPTSQWTESHEWWAPEIVKYLYDGRFDLNPHLTILADIKVQPTASSPLTRLEAVTGARSGIVGHPKLQMRTIATPQSKLPKIMLTTGAVTTRNYTDTKAGKTGEFHHSFGATVVEVDGDKFHTRQIGAVKDGSFIDLNIEATPKGCRKAPRAAGLIMGDTHVDFVDPDVVEATFNGPGSIVRALNPKALVWHDLLDFYSRNHHHKKDPFTQVAKHKSGFTNVRREIVRACDFVKSLTPRSCNSIIVPSNHIDALTRWLREVDWRDDLENADFYLETALAMVRSAKVDEHGASVMEPFTYWASKKLDAVFLRRDESHMIKDIEVGMHGDNGPNGSRGVLRSFSRIGVRSIIGHSHTPGIEEGCYQVGTSTRLKLEYSRGAPSSWLNTHCVIYANGKRSLINIIDGEWRIPVRRKK